MQVVRITNAAEAKRHAEQRVEQPRRNGQDDHRHAEHQSLDRSDGQALLDGRENEQIQLTQKVGYVAAFADKMHAVGDAMPSAMLYTTAMIFLRTVVNGSDKDKMCFGV